MRTTRALLLGGAILAVLATLATLATPEIVRRLAVGRLSTWFTVPVRIEDVDVNLLTGRVRVSELVVGGGDGGPPILRVPTLDLDLSYPRYLAGETFLESLTVHEPELLVERSADRGLNVLRALRPGRGSGGGVNVGWLEIRGGTARFVDRAAEPPLERTFQDVQLTARDISNVSGHVDPTAFEAGLSVGPGTVQLAGRVQPFDPGAGVEVRARLRSVDPSSFGPYLPLPAGIDLTGSSLDADVRYLLARAGGHATSHLVEASGTLGAARWISPAHGTPVLAVAGLAATDIRVDLVAGRGTVGELVVRSPRLRVVREAGGVPELATLLAGDHDAARPDADRAGATAFPLLLRRIRLEDGTLDLRDATLDPPATAVLHPVEGTLAGLTLGEAGARPADVHATARLGNASLDAKGTLQPAPLRAAATLTFQRFPIDTLEAYANAALGVPTVRSGTFEGRLDVRLERNGGEAVQLVLGGSLTGRDLAFGVPGLEVPLLTTDRLIADVRRLTVLPSLSAHVDRIALTAPALHLRRLEDGSLNLRRLWRAISEARQLPGANPRSETPAAPPAAGSDLPALRIDHIELTAGSILFRDTAVAPRVAERVTGLAVSVGDLGGGGRSPVRLTGRVGRDAPLTVRGWVAPFGGPLRFHLEAAVTDYELTRLDPYWAQLVGYRVRRGQGGLAMAYDYDGRELSGRNTLTLERLELGQAVSDRFRDRIGVPLPLALSILERPGGELRLEVPVSGEISKPQVSFAGVLEDAVRATLVRVVTAPFRLVGGVLTRAGRITDFRIAPIPFVPATTTPSVDPFPRMAALAQVLRQRPKLELEIEGHATSEEIAALKRKSLEQSLAATGLNEHAALAQLYAEAGGERSFGPVSDEVMRERLVEQAAVPSDALARLARRRARLIEGMLVTLGVEPGRVFLAREPRNDPTSAGSPGVELRLLY